jgi:hypothetical protein
VRTAINRRVKNNRSSKYTEKYNKRPEARGGILQAGRSLVRDPMRRIAFSIYLILAAALDPGVYSGFNKNEYQK